MYANTPLNFRYGSRARTPHTEMIIQSYHHEFLSKNYLANTDKANEYLHTDYSVRHTDTCDGFNTWY